MTQPTEELIVWANTDVNLPKLAGPNKTKPIDDLINKGWDFTEKPAADEFNYILNNMGKWINWTITDIEAGTSLNTPNTLVRRDGSGNFSAGTITAALTGNSSTATTLQNSRTINGTSFNGSTNITTNSWGTSRTFALAGAVTGSVSIDGSGNVTLNTSVSSTSGVSILTGTISHGGTIPLPSGYSEGQCCWMVSMNNDNPSNTAWDWQEGVSSDHIHSYCSANGTRVVTCYRTVRNETGTQTHNGTANYIIIGVK